MRICATSGPLCRGVEGAPSWTLSSEAARPVTFIHISLCGFFRHREPTNQFLSSLLFKREPAPAYGISWRWLAKLIIYGKKIEHYGEQLTCGG